MIDMQSLLKFGEKMFKSKSEKKIRGQELNKLMVDEDVKNEEKILVFPAIAIEDLGSFDNKPIVTDQSEIDCYLECIFGSDETLSELSYKRRGDMEEDPSFKQVIPYVILKRGREILRYQRTKKGGESRLHDKWSIGVGGHVEPIDGEANKQSYVKALKRELLEEVGLSIDILPEHMNIVGLLYDESNNVGKVHFGIIHMINVPLHTQLRFTEDCIDNAEFRHIIDIRKSLKSDNYENWSQIAIQHLLC